MKLLLIRHSIREINDESDCSISMDGIKLIDDRFQEIMNCCKFVNPVILSSPFKRTIDTAICIASKINRKSNIIIEQLLHETIYHSKMQEKLSDPLSRYIDCKIETHDDILNRSIQFLDKIKIKNNTDTIAITHGGVINSILSLVDPNHKSCFETDPDKYVPRYLDYVLLEYNDAKWIICYKNF